MLSGRGCNAKRTIRPLALRTSSHLRGPGSSSFSLSDLAQTSAKYLLLLAFMHTVDMAWEAREGPKESRSAPNANPVLRST